MKNIKTVVGSRIRMIRRKKGISLREFEKIIGISRSEISKIETGKRNPTLDTIKKIADALDCNIEIFFTEK